MKGDEFFFEQTETWSNDEFDSKHPLKYTVTPPVMPEKIKVSGSQWIEPHLTGSKLGFRLEVSVGIFGIGGQIASGVMKGTIESFEKVPGRAVEYVKAHGEVDAALEEEKTLGHTLPSRSIRDKPNTNSTLISLRLQPSTAGASCRVTTKS